MSLPDSASTDLVLKCHAPSVIAEAWRRAQSGLGDARERLGWRLGFADVVQRFLVAALAPDCAGLGLPTPPAMKKLADKLEAASLGDWGRAAESLAGDLHAHVALGPVTLRLARILVAEDGTRTQAAADLQSLVDLRNELFHRDGSPMVSEARAKAELESTEDRMRRLGVSLRVLRDFPIVYVARQTRGLNRSLVAVIQRFAGIEPTSLTVAVPDSGSLPDRQPFLMSADGTVLVLAPFLVVAAPLAGGLATPHLLAGWSAEPTPAGFVYSESHGGARCRTSPEEEPPITTREGLKALPMALRCPNACPPELVTTILGTATPAETREFGPYSIEGALGRGASSRVLLARERLSGRPPSEFVALKILDAAVAADASARERLRREHRILRRLTHANIVRALAYGEEPAPHIVMEYVRGEDLAAAVQRKPLPPRRVAQLMDGVLAALEHAHAEGVVHRDIKPSNILIDSSGTPRVVDFGIATTESLSKLTRTMDAMGTAVFAAPEQLCSLGAVDARADLYAVGRVIEFLVTGDVGPHGTVSDQLPAGLFAVVRRATQWRPEHRFASAAEMRGALAERSSTGFLGAPIQAGDLVSDSYRLLTLHAEDSGIWMFNAEEICTGEPTCVALAPTTSAGATLLTEAARGLPGPLRRTLGLRSTQRTPDGLLFVVFDAGDPALRIRQFLRGDSDTPKPHPSTYTLSEAAQVLGAPGTAIEMHESLEALFRVLFACWTVAAGWPIEVGRCRSWWSEPGTAVFRRFSLVFEHFGDTLRPLADEADKLKVVVARLERVRMLRNREAHGVPERTGPDADVRAALAEFSVAVAAIAARVDPGRLAPFVARMEDGEWALLDLRRTPLARTLVSRTSSRPSDEALRWAQPRTGAMAPVAGPAAPELVPATTRPRGTGAPRAALPVVFVVDSSGSMAGGRMHTVNASLASAITTLASLETTLHDIQVAVVTFGSGAALHIPLDSVCDVRWRDIVPAGTTDMGHGVRLAAEALQRLGSPGASAPHRPLLVLVADGSPTDDWHAGLERLLASPPGSWSERVALALGDMADTDVLSGFQTEGFAPLLVAQTDEAIVEFFERIARCTATRASVFDPSLIRLTLVPK